MKETLDYIQISDSELDNGDILMVVKNNYTVLGEESEAGFVANGEFAIVKRIGREEEMHGFRFQNVTLQLIDYPEDPPFETLIFLDTLYSNLPSLSQEENKKILLVFSGSDWCAPCMKLDKVVWQSDIFKTDSGKNWIIYKADFPKKKANQLTEAKTKENKQLAEKYNIEGSFPLVVLLDKNAKVIAMTGYKNITAEEYVKLIHSFEK